MEKLIVTSPIELSTLIEDSLRKVLSDQIIQRDEDKLLPELLSINQAADYLNLAKQTLYGFTSNRTIPFIKKGKKLYFRKSDLDKWLSEGRKLTMDEIGDAIFKKGKGGKHG